MRHLLAQAWTLRQSPLQWARTMIPLLKTEAARVELSELLLEVIRAEAPPSPLALLYLEHAILVGMVSFTCLVNELDPAEVLGVDCLIRLCNCFTQLCTLESAVDVTLPVRRGPHNDAAEAGAARPGSRRSRKTRDQAPSNASTASMLGACALRLATLALVTMHSLMMDAAVVVVSAPVHRLAGALVSTLRHGCVYPLLCVARQEHEQRWEEFTPVWRQTTATCASVSSVSAASPPSWMSLLRSTVASLQGRLQPMHLDPLGMDVGPSSPPMLISAVYGTAGARSAVRHLVSLDTSPGAFVALSVSAMRFFTLQRLKRIPWDWFCFLVYEAGLAAARCASDRSFVCHSFLLSKVPRMVALWKRWGQEMGQGDMAKLPCGHGDEPNCVETALQWLAKYPHLLTAQGIAPAARVAPQSVAPGPSAPLLAASSGGDTVVPLACASPAPSLSASPFASVTVAGTPTPAPTLAPTLMSTLNFPGASPDTMQSPGLASGVPSASSPATTLLRVPPLSGSTSSPRPMAASPSVTTFKASDDAKCHEQPPSPSLLFHRIVQSLVVRGLARPEVLQRLVHTWDAKADDFIGLGQRWTGPNHVDEVAKRMLPQPEKGWNLESQSRFDNFSFAVEAAPESCSRRPSQHKRARCSNSEAPKGDAQAAGDVEGTAGGDGFAHDLALIVKAVHEDFAHQELWARLVVRLMDPEQGLSEGATHALMAMLLENTAVLGVIYLHDGLWRFLPYVAHHQSRWANQVPKLPFNETKGVSYAPLLLATVIESYVRPAVARQELQSAMFPHFPRRKSHAGTEAPADAAKPASSFSYGSVTWYEDYLDSMVDEGREDVTGMGQALVEVLFDPTTEEVEKVAQLSNYQPCIIRNSVPFVLFQACLACVHDRIPRDRLCQTVCMLVTNLQFTMLHVVSWLVNESMTGLWESFRVGGGEVPPLLLRSITEQLDRVSKPMRYVISQRMARLQGCAQQAPLAEAMDRLSRVDGAKVRPREGGSDPQSYFRAVKNMIAVDVIENRRAVPWESLPSVLSALGYHRFCRLILRETWSRIRVDAVGEARAVSTADYTAILLGCCCGGSGPLLVTEALRSIPLLVQDCSGLHEASTLAYICVSMLLFAGFFSKSAESATVSTLRTIANLLTIVKEVLRRGASHPEPSLGFGLSVVYALALAPTPFIGPLLRKADAAAVYDVASLLARLGHPVIAASLLSFEHEEDRRRALGALLPPSASFTSDESW